VTQLRKRVHHELTFNERLADHARKARGQAELLPVGKERDALLEKARQFESQISFNDELFEESRR
jgi:hypothetical protein